MAHKALNPSSPIRHLHEQNQSLYEHENAAQFGLYLNGRATAYDAIIAETEAALAKAQEIQQTHKSDAALWALAEGQIEGLKEIRTNLRKLRNTQPNN